MEIGLKLYNFVVDVIGDVPQEMHFIYAICTIALIIIIIYIVYFPFKILYDIFRK